LISERKKRLRETADSIAPKLDIWRERNAFFHANDIAYLRFLVPPGLRILELGCGTGSVLAALEPAEGVGVDFSPAMIEIARCKHPQFSFHCGDVEEPETIRALGDRVFDVILMIDTIGVLNDIQATFERLHGLCDADTRVIVAYHSRLWDPILRLGERLGLKMPSLAQNWLVIDDIAAILSLSSFEEVKREWRQLVPRSFFGIGRIINRWLAPLPLLRKLALRNVMVFRSRRVMPKHVESVSVVIPARNERGNIESAVKRLPRFAPRQEIIFVEGHSRDGTQDEIERVIAAYPELDIKCLVQTGIGKGDAVRAGFAAATGDVLMILDADLTVAPEDLPKFWRIIAEGSGEFINGTRLVYAMEDGAMRFLNLGANHVFALLFTYLLNQRITDTLCGTKVITRRHYERLVAGRHYFGDFDPFGDFDLIFGAAKLNLKLKEVPIRYAARTYGETQISRFRHGWLLLRMVVFAWWKMKAL
jgi:SAM-dependent methyltransferase